MPVKWIGVLVAGLLLAGCNQASNAVSADSGAFEVVTNTGPVHEFRLKNGLKVLVREDHRAPVVVSQIWYKVGATYEHDGITGVSHMFEHLMFKGTKNLKPGEFSRIISANGGRENAFTGRDYTAYFQRLEKSRLEVSFRLEAERMRNLLFDDAEIEKERKVVMEERRLHTEDNPHSQTYEQFNATAFLSSPTRNPVIGWMRDLESLTKKDLQDWYRAWYAPNNATLVVVGDVDPLQVAKLANKHFGPLQPSTLAIDRERSEIKQMGERRINLYLEAKVPYMIMGYKTPVLRTVEEDWEVYALDVLASVLDGGSSARFAREIVRGSQVATSVGAGYSATSRLSGLFIFDGTPAAGKSLDDVETAIEKQIERVKTELVSQQELDRIKAQVAAAKVFEKDSMFYQGMQMGIMETVGLDWRILNSYDDRIKAVTPLQLQKVARKYLVTSQRTVARLFPRAQKAAKAN